MPSKKKNSPAAYEDVKLVMDLAVNKPNLQYILPSYGKAIHFKQRCNHYRNLLREMAAEQAALIPGYRAQTAYDLLVIRQIDETGKSSRTGNIILFEHQTPTGVIIDPETNQPIEIDGLTNVYTQGGLSDE